MFWNMWFDNTAEKQHGVMAGVSVQVLALPFWAVGPQWVYLIFFCLSFNMYKGGIILVSVSNCAYEYLMK